MQGGVNGTSFAAPNRIELFPDTNMRDDVRHGPVIPSETCHGPLANKRTQLLRLNL